MPITWDRVIWRGLRPLAAVLLICAALAPTRAARNDEGGEGSVRLRV